MVRFFIGGNLMKNYLHKGKSYVLPTVLCHSDLRHWQALGWGASD